VAEVTSDDGAVERSSSLHCSAVGVSTFHWQWRVHFRMSASVYLQSPDSQKRTKSRREICVRHDVCSHLPRLVKKCSVSVVTVGVVLSQIVGLAVLFLSSWWGVPQNWLLLLLSLLLPFLHTLHTYHIV